MDYNISQVPVCDLIEYANNPRKNSHVVDNIAAAIKEFGFRIPIIAKSDGTIVDGHLRLKAAKKLKLETVPVLNADDMTEVQIKAFRISVNKMADLADWDEQMLKLEFEALQELDFDLSLTGFSDDEIASLTFEESEGLTDDDAVPDAPEEPVAIEGDIWILGEHRVMCGDSTDAGSVALLMDGHKADQLLTDPPYNVNYEGKTKNALKIKNDKMSNDSFREFLTAYMAVALENMKAGASFYIWHADLEGYNFRGSIHDCGEEVRQCLIWNKQNMVMGRQDYHWKHEPCLYGWKSGASHLWANDRKQTTVLEFDRPSRNDVHPTMKPVALMEYCIKNNTKGSDIIYDAFLGSGSTLIAAEKTGRKCYGMELDPKYVDVIIKRWQDYTGKQATMAGDTYDDIAKARGVFNDCEA